jgi:hypothetical protein
VQKQDGLAVQEDRVDVLVRQRRLFRASRHAEWPQETRHQHLHLLHVLLLGLHHPEHEAAKLIRAHTQGSLSLKRCAGANRARAARSLFVTKRPARMLLCARPYFLMVALINNAIRPDAHAKALGKAWIWFVRS